MKKSSLFLGFLSACAAGSMTAGEIKTVETTTTTTLISQKVVTRTEKIQWSPFKVCVLDFTVTDIVGDKRFRDQHNRAISIPAQSTLNDADRKSINSVMQGFVRMIDAWDNTKTNKANRVTQIQDNRFDRARALDLYRSVVTGTPRPMVIGADYLSAYLSKYGQVFSCVDRSIVSAAMEKLRQDPEFPRDFMLKLARETGATHLIYGTVSDLRTRHNSFKGYGIETKTTNYQLDVMIKLVDLAAQGTVYGNVYTGTYREQRPVSSSQFDDNIFQSLMTSALQQAAEDLYDACRPGRKNKIKVTPLPCRVTVNVTGGMFFKPSSAEIFLDDTFAGNGNTSFLIPQGPCTLTVKAAGYKTKTLKINAHNEQVIQVKLEK